MPPRILQKRFTSTRMIHKQNGAALLLFISIIVLSVSAFLLTGISRNQHALDSPFKNIDVLSQAKKGLIAYARLSDLDLNPVTGLNMRYLPCPDLDGDGLEETPCGIASAEGWLPWMSLGLPPLKDSSEYCLRYFISSGYKQGAPSAPLISALPSPDFTLSDLGGVISTDVVAVIIAPGSVLSGQNRSATPLSITECGSTTLASPKNQAANYMDNFAGIDNALPPSFIKAPIAVNATANFNDTLLVILSSDL